MVYTRGRQDAAGAYWRTERYILFRPSGGTTTDNAHKTSIVKKMNKGKL